MVYVFGIDLPLMELFFVFLIAGVILAVILLYVMYKVMQINRKMDFVLRQEKKKYEEFSTLTEEERKEIQALRRTMAEMDRIVSEEESAVQAIEKIKEARAKHRNQPADKGKDFVKALLGAALKHEANPVWATEKWKKEGLVLVKRSASGNVIEWKKHPLSGIPEHKLPWKKEHWKSEGDVMVLRRDDGTLIDWEKL